MSADGTRKAVRLLSEDEAADVLRRGGSKHATARTVRWLLQRDGAPARPDYLVDLAAVADYLRAETRKAAPGLAGVARLFDQVVPKGARPRALTYAERQAKSRARSRHNDIGEEVARALLAVNWRRRRRAEKDFVYFLKTYCTGGPTDGAFLEVAPPKSMVPICENMAQSISEDSVPFHVRMPRGHGKTAYTKGGAKWVAAFGIRRYLIVVGANGENAENIISDVFAGMTDNPAFVHDFPEIALPFIRLAGAYQRAKTQTADGKLTGLRKASDCIVLPTVTDPRTGCPFPSSGVIIEALGFDSGARGKARMTQRPDLVILDDLQNDDRAESSGQVLKMVRKVKRTFLGLAGHRKRLAVIMTSTPIEADDLSETFAADPAWRTLTYRMIESWPTCHDPEADPETKRGIHDWWEDYWDIYVTEKNASRPPHVAANKFYRAHRKEMDAGARVLNPSNYDPKTELSGIQHAMNLMFLEGLEAFMSEYQMKPPVHAFAISVTARLVLSRVRKGWAANTPLPGSVLTTAATDVNPGYAITTSVISWDIQLTGLVMAYHVLKVKIPDKLNDTEFAQAVHHALETTAQELERLGVHIDVWGVDAGGRNFNAVTNFTAGAEAAHGIRTVSMLGRAGQNWNPNVRSRIRRERNDTVLCADSKGRRWIAFNADVMKERAHLALGTDTGAPGGLTIFDGGANHARLATQVANEKLISKTKIKTADGKDRYAYKWKSADPHDYLDTLSMNYALAASENLTGEGNGARLASAPSCKVGGISVGPSRPSAAPAVAAGRPRIMVGHA